MPSDDSTPRVPLGPVGGYVIANLLELRAERRLSYKDLSDRLSQLGRSIPTLGLSRIEKGNRRVDVDDLVALALALGVNPAALLLPRDVPPDGRVRLTEGATATARDAWNWADGRWPLPFPFAGPGAKSTFDWHRVADFEAHARPEWSPLPEYARFGPADNGGPSNYFAREEAQLPVVAAIVTSRLGVLVGRRNDGKPPWTFIAGEQDAVKDENPADTAVREVKEETGLRVEAGDVIGERVHPKTRRTMVYVAAVPTHGTEVFVGDEDELAEVRWVSLAEADELLPGMYEPVREHLARELGEA
jgi:8-oxo-dGTP pyrophosphatase MutT (NUDIX family)/transcriptional regulator with XRE-family HTH domain